MAAVPPAQGGMQILGKMAIQTVLFLHASRRTTDNATDSDVASPTVKIYERHLKNLTDRGCSFSASAEREIVRDVTEKVCFFGIHYDAEYTTAVIDKEKTYVLLGENHHCRPERFRFAEVLFVAHSAHLRKLHSASRHFLFGLGWP